jgi:hypothetical protein
MHMNVQTVSYTTASGPVAVAIGDVNNDSYLDLAVTNKNISSVSIFLGSSAGTFSLDKSYSVGKAPHSIAIADLNNDDYPDIVTANWGDDTVSILIRNADGTFSIDTYPVGENPISIAIGDLNKDGRLDIVTANYDGNSVSVLYNTGLGFVSSIKFQHSVGRSPHSVVIEDLNRDGNLDIITANSYDNSVLVLWGNDDNIFSTAKNSTYSVGARPFSVVISDVNKDGRLDIITANFKNNSVSVLIGGPDDSFSQSQGSPYAVGAGSYSVAVADLNKDGYLDLVTANENYDSISVLLGNAARTFSTAPNSPYSVGDRPVAVAIADFNSDGNLDLAAVNFGSNSISIIYGTVDGPFSQSLGNFLYEKQAPYRYAMQATVITIAAIVVPTVICLLKKIVTLTSDMRQLKARVDTADARLDGAALERKLPPESETQGYKNHPAVDDVKEQDKAPVGVVHEDDGGVAPA